MQNNKIHIAAIKGIIDGEKAWRRISGSNDYIDLNTQTGRRRRNEQCYSSFISNGIYEIIEERHYISHETNHFLLEMAIRRKTITEGDSEDNRYDLVIWGGQDQPYAIIEVKLTRPYTHKRGSHAGIILIH